MKKGKNSKYITYYAIYKYNEEKEIVHAEILAIDCYLYFKGSTFQETYKAVDSSFRSLAYTIKNDPCITIPTPVEFEEVQSKYKTTDGYKYSKLIFNPKTGEVTHTKLGEVFEMHVNKDGEIQMHKCESMDCTDSTKWRMLEGWI